MGLDDYNMIDDNIAIAANDIWKEVMNDKTSEIATFVEFMKLLEKSHKGFKHTMLLDSNGNYTGYIWQTAIMSDNFNRYGHYISTDALKWDINTFLWNYVAIALINEIGKLCLGAEGIICSERL